MSSPYALFRLMWRPLTLAFAWGVFMGSVWPLLRLSELEGGPFLALWHRGSEPLVRSAAWQLGVLLPLFLGGVLAAARADLSNSMLGWTLPGVRRGIAIALALVAAPIIAGFYVLLLRGGPPEEAVAAAALAGLWFMLPGALAGWQGQQIAVALPFAAFAALLPSRYGALVAAAPLLAGALAIILAAALFRSQVSASSARGHTLFVDRQGRKGEGWLSTWFMGSRAEWSTSLAHSRLWPWLHAGAFEAGTGSVARYFRGIMMGAAIWAIYAHFAGGGQAAAIMIGVMVSNSRLRVNSGLPYPLSRYRRAGLAYLGAIVNMTLLLSGVVALILLLRLVPFPESWALLRSEELLPKPLGLGMVLIFLPIVLFPVITSPPEHGGKPVFDLVRSFGSITIFLIVMAPAIVLMPRLTAGVSSWVLLGGCAAGCAVTYRLLWWATHRHFARADLSPVEAGR